MVIKSLREAISKVRGSLRIQNINESSLPDRLIGSLLQDVALLFIKQATDKRKLWNSNNIFTNLPCVKLCKVPLAECGSYTSQVDVSRSLVKLPKIAEGNNFGMLVQGVWSVDLISRRFIESTPDRFANSLQLEIFNKPIHFWLQDKYLYVGSAEIEKVRIAAYFEEDIPDNLIDYPSYCKDKTIGTKGCCSDSTTTSTVKDYTWCCPKNPYDLEFRCPGYMTSAVIDKVCQDLMKEYVGRPEANTTGFPEAKK